MAVKPKLLVVEDDDGLRSQYRWAFPSCEVMVATARPSAIAAVRKERPQAVILDLGLPPDPDGVSDGFAIVAEVLRIAPETKIIVVTGNGERRHALKAISLGAYDFCEKPVEIELLRTIIERGLYLHRLEDENRRLAAMPARSPIERVITASPAMLKVCRDIEKLAATHVPVLLGPVDKPGPESKAAERDEAKEAACGLVIAGSDPALFLEVADEALNA
jgi:two-component system, NtrC family, response regulator